MTSIFIHGLDSSSKGTKASWFARNFPQMLVPDFKGSLEKRLTTLENVLAGKNDLLLIGSSFGGLMAAIFAIEQPETVREIVMLAPALNFPEFDNWRQRTSKTPARLYVGDHDDVCPPDKVIGAARKCFENLTVQRTNDDHIMRKTFALIDWGQIIRQAD